MSNCRIPASGVHIAHANHVPLTIMEPPAARSHLSLTRRFRLWLEDPVKIVSGLGVLLGAGAGASRSR